MKRKSKDRTIPKESYKDFQKKYVFNGMEDEK